MKEEIKAYNSVLDLIGNTPLIKLNKISADLPGNFYAKVEAFNPGHSTKDRIALYIIEEAEKSGYLVIILQSNESLELEKKQVELLINKRVDGIIMSLSNESNDDEHIKEIIKREIPFVLFDKISKFINCSKVIIDDQKAAYNAVEHLISKGCKKIAHIRGPVNPQNAIDRFLGYKKALEKHNIPFDYKLVYTCKNVTFEEGKEFAKQIVKNHPDIDGIFVIFMSRKTCC